jgi:hypothetical protein
MSEVKIENAESIVPATEGQLKTFDLSKVTQKDIPNIVDTLRSELKKFTKSGDELVPHISGILPGYGDVSKIEDVPTLVKILCGIEFKAEKYNAKLEQLGLNGTKAFAFEEQGHSLKKWQDFLVYRIDQVRHKKKIKNLSERIKELENMMSEEDRLRKTLQKVLVGVEDDLV